MVSAKTKCTVRIALILVPALLILAFALKAVVDPLLFDRPEPTLAKLFIETNATVRALVGEVARTELDQRNSRLSIMPDRAEGQYDFRVVGNKGSEKVRLVWTCSHEDNNCKFLVEQVWLLRKGAGAERIWP